MSIASPPVPELDGARSVPMRVAPAPVASLESPAAPGQDESFIAKLRAAMANAVVFPSALRGGIQTSVEVACSFRDGVVSSVHVVQPGRVGMFRAAVGVVTHAVMPQTPPAMSGVSHTFKVRLIFKDGGVQSEDDVLGSGILAVEHLMSRGVGYGILLNVYFC